jgi:periplasmic protein TonB
MRRVTAGHVTFVSSALLHLLLFSIGIRADERSAVSFEKYEVRFTPPADRPAPEETANKTPPVRSRKPPKKSPPVEDRVSARSVPKPPAPAAEAPEETRLYAATDAAATDAPPLETAAPAEVRREDPAAEEPSFQAAPATKTARLLDGPAEDWRTNRLGDYLAFLGRMLERNKDYPLFARQRGLQGTVVVRASIRADGAVADVAVISSSGHGSLDKAAVAVVKGAGSLKPPASFGLADVTVDIPIAYGLR